MFGFFGKKKTLKESLATKLNASIIVPRIKHLNFLEALKPLLTQAAAQGANPADQMPVTRPLVGDLIVTYAFSLPETFMMVTRQSMLELGLDADSTHRAALTNLSQSLTKLAVQDLHFYKALVTGEHLEACCLLLPDIWSQLAAKCAGELLITVPARDAVFFMDSRHQVDLRDQGAELVTSGNCLGLMCEASQGRMAEATTHGLSTHIFAWRNQAWSAVGLLANPNEVIVR